MLLPITSPIAFGGAEGAIRPPSVLLAAIAIAIIRLACRTRLPDDFPSRVLCLAMLVVIVLGGLSGVIAQPDIAGGGWLLSCAKEILALLVGVLCYFFARSQMRHPEDVLTALRWLLSGFGCSILFAVLQTMTAGSSSALRLGLEAWSLLWSSTYADGGTALAGRGNGLAYEPSYLASQLMVLIPLGACAVAHPSGWGIGSAWLCLAVFGATATGSRFGMLSAWAVAAFSWMWITFCARIALQRKALLAAALLLSAGLGVALVAGNAYVNSACRMGEASVQEWSKAALVAPRLAMLEAGLGMFLDRPLLGHGLGSSAIGLREHLPGWYASQDPGTVWYDPNLLHHPKQFSGIVKVLAELGLVGAAAILWALLMHAGVNRGWRTATLGAIGACAIIADGISMASFARPWPWLLLAALQAGCSQGSSVTTTTGSMRCASA